MATALRKGIVVAVTAACVVFAAWVVAFISSVSEAPQLRFCYLGQDGELVDSRTFTVGEATLSLSLNADIVSDFDGSPLCRALPYLRLRVRKRAGAQRLIVDTERAYVADSEGHRFKAVAIKPESGSRDAGAYRIDIDSIEFGKHLKRQASPAWARSEAAWAVPSRYTLAAYLPVICDGEEHLLALTGLACFANEAFRQCRGLPFVPESRRGIGIDQTPMSDVAVDGVVIGANTPVKLLVSALRHEDAVVRAAAVDALATLPSETGRVLPALIAVAKNDQNPVVKTRAANAIHSLTGKHWSQIEEDGAGGVR